MWERLGGLAILLAGAAIFYLFLWLPLQQARAAVPQVHYELRVFALVPLCLVFGLVFLIFGKRFEYRTENHDNLTAKGWAAFALVTVLSFVGWWWFDTQFTALGYQ